MTPTTEFTTWARITHESTPADTVATFVDGQLDEYDPDLTDLYLRIVNLRLQPHGRPGASGGLQLHANGMLTGPVDYAGDPAAELSQAYENTDLGTLAEGYDLGVLREQAAKDIRATADLIERHGFRDRIPDEGPFGDEHGFTLNMAINRAIGDHRPEETLEQHMAHMHRHTAARNALRAARVLGDGSPWSWSTSTDVVVKGLRKIADRVDRGELSVTR